MRGAVVVACSLLVACSPPGLTFEVVTDDPAIDTVQLFIGEHCDDCPSAMSAPMVAPRSADMYVMHDGARWTESVDGGVAGFRIATDEDTFVHLIIAVGMDGDVPRAVATIRDVDVPADSPLYWKVLLTPATEIADPQAPLDDGAEAVALWRHPEQVLPSCVMVEHWRDGRATRDAIVPFDDRDCDRVDPMLECAPYAPNATNLPPTIRDASCVTLTSAAASVCVLGGPPCNEGPAPSVLTCDRLVRDYCTPMTLCGCDFADPRACLAEKIQQGTVDGSMVHIKCEIPTEADGAPCGGSPPIIPLDASSLVAGGGVKCDAMRLNELELPLGVFTSSTKLGTATLKLLSFTDSCNVSVELYDKYAATAPGRSRELRLLELDLDNDKHLVVPFAIDIVTGGCGNVTPACNASGGNAASTDTIFSCARPPAPVTSCGPEGACAGPVCGVDKNICCAAGEQCVNHECRCGTNAECGFNAQCQGPTGTPDECGSCCGTLELPCR